MLLRKIYLKFLKFFYIKHKLLILKRESNFQSSNGNNNSCHYIRKLNDKHLQELPKKQRNILIQELSINTNIYGIYVNGKLAHYSCVTMHRHRIGEINRIINTPNNCIYIFNCYTFPEYRGKGLYPLMLHFLKNEYKNYTQYIAVLDNNIPSLKVIKKSNFEKVGNYEYKKVLKKEKYNRSTSINYLFLDI
jgi:hypothetical protein